MDIASLVQSFFESAVLHPGWTLLFVIMILEMGMIIHFLPTELVLVAATLSLVHGPGTLTTLVLVATTGSGLGTLIPYAASRYGGRPFVDRHRRLFRLSPKRLDGLEGLFRRASGESMVFLLRCVPGLRTFPSIPAGLARMDWRRFLLWSTLGCGLFNFAIVWVTYEGSHPGPLARSLATARDAFVREASDAGDYWASHWPLGLIMVASAAWALVVLWRRRRSLERNIDHALHLVWERTALVALLTGVLLLGGALVAPAFFYHIVAWIAVDFTEGALGRGLRPAAIVALAAIDLLIVAGVLHAVGYGVLAALKEWRRRHASPTAAEKPGRPEPDSPADEEPRKP